MMVMTMNGRHLAVLILLLLTAATVAGEPAGEDVFAGLYAIENNEKKMTDPLDESLEYVHGSSTHQEPAIGRYHPRYVGANSAAIDWTHIGQPGQTFRYNVYDDQTLLASIATGAPQEFRHTGMERGRQYNYRIVVERWNTTAGSWQYHGFIDQQPQTPQIIPGQVWGDLSSFGATDTWSGGFASLKFDMGDGYVGLGGGTLILDDITLTGEWDDWTQRYTYIWGPNPHGGAIQATDAVFESIRLSATNAGTARSFLNNCHATNTNLVLIGPNIGISDSYFTGNRSNIQLLDADNCQVTNNHFVDISGGIYVTGDRTRVTDNLFGSFEGPANTAGYAIRVGGSQGLISGNTITNFRSGIQITGSQRVLENTIWNTTNRDATDLVRRSLKVIEAYNADGSVIEGNHILDTAHPNSDKGVIYVERTGDIEIRGNTIDGWNNVNGISVSEPGGFHIIAEDNLITNTTRPTGARGINANNRWGSDEVAIWILNNTITGGGDAGIFLNYYDLANVINNTISGPGTGIRSEGSMASYVAENTILDVGTGISIGSFGAASEDSNFSANTIESRRHGVYLNARNTVIGKNTIHITGTDLFDFHTGITVSWRSLRDDQNIIQGNTIHNNAEYFPIDISIETLSQELPGTTVLIENTIERGGNRTTFSITDYTEQIQISGVAVPPPPPRYPDYHVNRGYIGQWISIRSNNFGNQEDVQLNLTFHYTPEELGGINEQSLSVWQHNTTRWHNGSVAYPWNGTRWLDDTTHEVGVQILSIPPWSAGRVIYAPLGSMPVRNLNLERDYETITEALNDWDLSAGHTITVESGYVGTENLQIIYDDITLVAASGLHSDVRVIAEDPLQPALLVRGADGVFISGFVLEGATGSYGLHLHGTENSRIERSTITGNRQGVCLEDYSIHFHAQTSNCTIADSIITGNTQGGILIFGTHQNTIEDCTISDPEYGVMIEEGEENVLSGNTFTDCLTLGIQVLRGDRTVIDENTITGWETGIFLDGAEGTAITGCHLSDANPDAASIGIRVHSSKDTTITGSSVSGITSMSAGATGVDLSGATLRTTILDSTIADIQTPQAIGLRVGAGAMNTWIDNITVTNFQAGHGGATGIFLAPGSGTSTIQQSTIDEIRSADLSRGIIADQATGAVIRKLKIDAINSTADQATGIEINRTDQVAVENITITRISGEEGSFAVSLTDVTDAGLDYITVGDVAPVLFDMTATGSLQVSGVETPPAPPADKPDIGKFLAITNSTPSEAALRIHYTEEEVTGIDPANLRLWRHADEWSRVPGENGVDLENRFVYAMIQDFSIFAPLAEPLRAEFSAGPRRGVAPLEVQFTDLSEGGPDSWAWIFGDGGSSGARHPIHLYETPGEYTVSLDVSRGDAGSTETKEAYITVLEPLVPDFTADVTIGSPPLTVQFTDTSTGDPVTWYWEFGDSATSTLRHPVMTYETPGLYTVNLTISHDDGAATISRPGYIRVYGPPEVTGITPDFGYRNGHVVYATITGSEFREGATVMLTGTPEISGTDVTVISGTEMTCRFDLSDVPTGIRDLRVTNTDGQAGSADAIFMIRPRGDFNGNGRVDIGDVSRVAWMAVGLVPEDPEARFSGAEAVTGADAARIAYFYVGKTQEI